MRLRAHATSIVLALGAAGAVAYAWRDRASVTETEKQARESSVFVAWRREDVTRIAIDHAGGEAIVLERTDDDAGGHDWWMGGEKANAEAVDKLVGTLEFATVVRKVDPTLAVPGLDAPRARVTVTMGAVVHQAALGGEAPTPVGAGYLREGDRTVVVARDLVSALLQPADTYRSRVVVPYLSVELSRLEVKTPAGDVAIARADETSFTLVPSGLRASREKLDGIWSALAELRAESFVSDAVAAPLVADPAARVTMTPSKPSQGEARAPAVLRLGGACPGHLDDVVVVRDAPSHVAACAPKGVLAGLTVTSDSLLDTHLFAAHDDEMAEVRLESLAPGAPGAPKSAAIDLARKEDAWRERAPAERDLTADEGVAATTLVSAIAKAEGAAPAKSDAPFEAKTRATVHRSDGVVEVVEIGAPDANGDATARRAFDGARLAVSSSVVRLLSPRAVALRPRDVWTPRLEGANAVAIESKCDDVHQVLARKDDAWTMESPAGFGADNSSVLDFIDAVERARAESWAADADDGHFGFGACSIGLTVTVDGGPRVVRIDLGREAEGGVYARTSDSPAVFVADKALRDRAAAWLIDLHGLAPTSPIDSLVLERGGRRVVLASDAGDDEPTDDAIRAASVLRADSVVRLGPARADEGFGAPLLTATIHGASGSKRVSFASAGDSDETVLARVSGIDATFAVERARIRVWLTR